MLVNRLVFEGENAVRWFADNMEGITTLADAEVGSYTTFAEMILSENSMVIALVYNQNQLIKNERVLVSECSSPPPPPCSSIPASDFAVTLTFI